MDEREKRFTRMAEIARAAAETGRCRALFACGSAGPEQHRLDAYSDLDFYLVVENGKKEQFLENLDWLEVAHPVAFHFRLSRDTVKLLFADGILAEMGVFDETELASESLTRGGWSAPARILWHAAGFDAQQIDRRPPPAPPERSVPWLLGEALTNLYTGLGRYRRGERLSAMRFIEGYCIDRLCELAPYLEEAQPVESDPWLVERRFEQRFPEMARRLPAFMQGYERVPDSAAAILNFLESHFTLNSAMADAVRREIESAT